MPIGGSLKNPGTSMKGSVIAPIPWEVAAKNARLSICLKFDDVYL